MSGKPVLSFIKCISCNGYKGPLDNAILKLKLIKFLSLKNNNAEFKDMDMNAFMHSTDNNVVIGDILDDLELPNICCRTHSLGITDFEVLFKNS